MSTHNTYFHGEIRKIIYPAYMELRNYYNRKIRYAFFFNSFGAKFQTTFVICFFYFNKLWFGKMFICKVDRLNVKQRRSRWNGALSHLIWIYAVCKSILLLPVAVKELNR